MDQVLKQELQAHAKALSEIKEGLEDTIDSEQLNEIIGDLGDLKPEIDDEVERRRLYFAIVKVKSAEQHQRECKKMLAEAQTEIERLIS